MNPCVVFLPPCDYYFYYFLLFDSKRLNIVLQNFGKADNDYLEGGPKVLLSPSSLPNCRSPRQPSEIKKNILCWCDKTFRPPCINPFPHAHRIIIFLLLDYKTIILIRVSFFINFMYRVVRKSCHFLPHFQAVGACASHLK